MRVRQLVEVGRVATGVSIGGASSGLQKLATAVAAAKPGPVAAGGARQSFAAQLQAMQNESGPAEAVAGPSTSGQSDATPAERAKAAGGAGSELAVAQESGARPVKVGPVAVAGVDGKPRIAATGLPVLRGLRDAPGPPASGATSGGLLEKGAVLKKACGAGERGGLVSPADSQRAGAESQSLIEVPLAPAPVVPVALAVTMPVAGAVASPKEGIGKVSAAHGHDTKKPVAAGHGAVAADTAGAGGEAVVTAGRVPIPAVAPLVAAPVAGSGGTNGTASGIATGPVLPVPEAAPSSSRGVTSHAAEKAADGLGHATGGELDAAGDMALGAPRTLVSTPNVLEVGITGGAHGWLRVRAELEHTGEVTASLVASSTASADALHKELGAMSAYLKSEAVGVSSLAVSALEKGGATPGAAGSSASAGTPSGGGRQEQQSGDGGPKHSTWAGLGNAASGLGTIYGSQSLPAASLGTGVGGWLNVRV